MLRTFKEWVDFVIYPLNPNAVLNAEERLDTTNSTTKEDELLSINPEKRKFRVTKDLIFFEDNEASFETMCIDEYGKVMIWTDNKVWFLLRDAIMERLQYVPRHPL